jgi:hypothetical protein
MVLEKLIAETPTTMEGEVASGAPVAAGRR